MKYKLDIEKLSGIYPRSFWVIIGNDLCGYSFSSDGPGTWIRILDGKMAKEKEDRWMIVIYKNFPGGLAISMIFEGKAIPEDPKSYESSVWDSLGTEYAFTPTINGVYEDIKELSETDRNELFRKLTEML